MNQCLHRNGYSRVKNWMDRIRDFMYSKSKIIPSDLIKDTEIVKDFIAIPVLWDAVASAPSREWMPMFTNRNMKSILALGGLCMNEDLDSIPDMNEAPKQGRHGYNFLRRYSGICH